MSSSFQTLFAGFVDCLKKIEAAGCNQGALTRDHGVTIRHTAFWNILLKIPDIVPHPGNRILCTLQAQVIPDHSTEPTRAKIIAESTE